MTCANISKLLLFLLPDINYQFILDKHIMQKAQFIPELTMAPISKYTGAPQVVKKTE